MKGLTPRQNDVWELKQSGKNNTQIAAQLGLSYKVVGKYMTTINKKLGLKRTQHGKHNPATEFSDPAKAAAVLDAMSDPRFTALTEACRAAGLPGRIPTSFINRMRLKYAGIVHEAKNLQKRELDELLGKKIHLMLEYIDDYNASQASVRDLAMGSAQLIEKQQLIRGQPTSIVSDHERALLGQLWTALIVEGQRRGMAIPGEFKEVPVEPERA